MDYGTRWSHVKKATLTGAGFGAVVVIVSVIGLTVEGTWSVRSAGLLLLGFLIYTLAFPLLFGFLALFRVRVRRCSVEHVFLGLFVIRRRPLSRFVHVELGAGGPRVVFDDGSRIRLLAMEPTEWSRMEKDLRAGAVVAKAAEQAGCDKPSRPVRVAPEWLTWQDSTVWKIAEELEREQRLDQLGVLADALEDAGCSDEVLLAHLRSAGPHVRECWALDVVLGKK